MWLLLMPRKASRTGKPPLLFAERPLGGARLQNVPEVRAALYPKEFFAETQAHSSSGLTSWVSPQFDPSVAAAPPVRRGRKKCQSVTSILDRCSQLSRKSSVCKFPSLSFQSSSRDQPHQPKNKRTKKATETIVVSGAGNQAQGSSRFKRAVSDAQHLDTPKRQSTSIRKRNEERFSDCAASSSRCFEQCKTPSAHGERCRVQSDNVSTPASSDISNTDLSSVGPAPDVDTPNPIQKGSSCPSSPSVHLLRAQPCTPPHNQPPDILVADTPERDYGLKVTWRRRRSQMFWLKERGHLSDSDVLIQS